MAHITLSQLTTVLQRIVSWATGKFAAKNTHSGKLEYADMPVVVLASMGSKLDGTSTQRPMSAGDTYYLPAGQGAGARIMFVDSNGTAVKISDPESNVIYCNAYTGLLYRWDASETDMVPVGGDGDGLRKVYVGNSDFSSLDTIYSGVYQVIEQSTQRIIGVLVASSDNKIGANPYFVTQWLFSNLVLSDEYSGSFNGYYTNGRAHIIHRFYNASNSSSDIPLNTWSEWKVYGLTLDEVSELLNAKQDTLTFDNAPTANSNNPVKSGGVYTALAGKQDTISDLATIRTGAGKGATAIQGIIVGSSEVTPDANRKVTIPAGVDGVTPHIGQNGNWWVGPETDSSNDTGIKARGNDGNVTVSDGVATLEVGNALNGDGDVLGMSGAMQIKANIDILAASLNRLYAKLGNIAFWTAQDQEDAEPTPIDWSIPKVVLTVTNSITHGVVKYNGNVVSGSIQVDQGTTVNLLVEGESGYGISSAAATGATVVDNGNGTFTVSVKVDSTMSLTITGTAAALVTPSFVCSNDADALSLTGASTAVGGTFVGTIAIEDDYFDGFTIESVTDGSDNDVTYTLDDDTITIANMPSVLVITAKATKVLKFYANKSINGMCSVADDSGICFTDLIRLDGLTSSAVLNWTHNLSYDANKPRTIVFYDKNKKHIMNWNSDNYKDCPYHFIVNSTGSRQIAANSLATMLSYAGGLAYVRACFDLNDGAMNPSNALTQGSSSWLVPSNTESADDLVVHNITYSLTGCTTNASSATTSHPARTNIINGENFQDTINVGSGKTLQSVTVTMDGVDITSTVYNSSTKKIVIASVTGALVITATAS